MLTNINGGFEIKAITTAIPQNELRYVDDVKNFNFPEKKSLKLQKVIGYDRHRIVPDNMTTSSLCADALEDIFNNTDITPNSIDGLISVTQTPDYFIPYNTGLIQKRLGLKEDIFTLDITQGCAGYVVGLMQSFMTLKLEGINRVALVAGEVLSKRANKKDRNSFPIIGDAGSATIIDINPDFNNEISYYYKSIGEKCFAIHIPAGGFAQPITEETSREYVRADGNIRSDNDFIMDGASVFAFTQQYVLKMIEDTLAKAHKKKDDIDYFLLHQPNKFMVSRMASDLGLDSQKVPMNIFEKYGNPGSASIPLIICDNHDILTQDRELCLAGFGAGLSLASIHMELHKVDYINLLEV